MASIVGVFTSPARKSGRSEPHERRQAIVGQGLEGCAHANPPKREVLFVSKEHLDSVNVEPGAIRENITVEGTDVEQWPVGQRVRAGEGRVRDHDGLRPLPPDGRAPRRPPRRAGGQAQACWRESSRAARSPSATK